MTADKETLDLDKIIELCEAALETNPNNATAHHDLGVALYQKQEVERALEHLAKAAELAPQSVLTHYLLGVAYADKLEFDEAIKSWKQVLQLDKPNKHKLNGMAHYFIGKVYGLKGLWDAARMELRRAEKLLPGNPLVMNASAEVHLAKGELAEAKAKWLAVAAAAPEDVRAAFNVCAIAIDTGDYQMAIEYGQKVLLKGQDSSGLRFNLGIAYLRMENFDAAIRELKKAVELDPKDLNSRLNLGEALVARGLVDDGVKEWEKAAEIYPEAPQPYYNAGLAYAREGLLDRAAEYWDKGIRRSPEYLPIYIAKGTSFAQAERWQESLAAWQEALRLNPEAEVVRINAMAVQLRLGQYEDALLLGQELPEQPDAMLIRALCHLQQGRQEEAWVTLSELRTSHGDIAERHARLIAEAVDAERLQAPTAGHQETAEWLQSLVKDSLQGRLKPQPPVTEKPENQGWWNSLIKTLLK